MYYFLLYFILGSFKYLKLCFYINEKTYLKRLKTVFEFKEGIFHIATGICYNEFFCYDECSTNAATLSF